LGDYIFHEGALPPTIQPDFEGSLFNSVPYRLLQDPAGWHSYFAIHTKRKKAVAAIYFHVADGLAQSPLRAPFGSVECSDDIPPQVLFDFLSFVDEGIKKMGVQRVVIKNAPGYTAARREALLQTFLINLDYRVITAEAGAIIPVSGNFEDRVDLWEKRKLKQAYSSGLQARELTVDQLDTVYLFILASRKQKGYSLSMTLTEVRRVLMRFLERFHLFGVYQDETLVAASIAVAVNDQTLYNFYSAHDGAYDHLSPVVMLIERLYMHCASRGLSLLDLGTSAVDGKPNFGLLEFKMRLGGVPTPKLTFEKTFS